MASFFSTDDLIITDYDIRTLANFTLRSKRRGEYSSACPVCDGHDRFRYWPDKGNFWCRQCDLRGFVADAPPVPRGPTLRDLIDGPVTSKTPEYTRWMEYHSNLYDTMDAQVYWYEALGPDYIEAVEEFKLGWCSNLRGFGASAVIPVSVNGRIILLKHRLITKETNKYFAEPSGINALLFGLDQALNYNKVVITEGEKKAMRLWLEGYPAVSPTNGANGFRRYRSWKVYFEGKETVVIFDPDTEGQKEGEHVANLLGAKNLVLEDKIDDMINSGFDISSVLGTPWR